MYELPTYVTTKDGRKFEITNKGDYRVVLRCFEAISDMELESEDESVLACLLIFYNEFKDFEDVCGVDKNTLTELTTQMFNFFNCNQPQGIGNNSGSPLIDWVGDEQIITAAINNVANTEVRSVEYLHWFTFMGYYLSVGESVLSTVVSIRDKMTKGKKLEDFEKKFQKDNPQYFTWKSKTRQQLEDEAYIRNLWNGGK